MYVYSYIWIDVDTDICIYVDICIYAYTYICICVFIHICMYSCIRRGKFWTNLSPSGRIRQVQNTTSYHNSGTMNLNSIRIGTVRGHALYKYPPRNTMPKSPGTNSKPLRISWSETSFSPTDWVWTPLLPSSDWVRSHPCRLEWGYAHSLLKVQSGEDP